MGRAHRGAICSIQPQPTKPNHTMFTTQFTAIKSPVAFKPGAFVEKVLPPRESSDFRRAANRFTCYTHGKARHIADEQFFSLHRIHKLEFKCLSWLKVGGFAAKIEAKLAEQALRERFGVEVELKFSRKAGCSCGCSPGFIGTMKDSFHPDLSRATVYVHETLSEVEKSRIASFAVQQEPKLKAEIAKQDAKIEREAAERAEYAKKAEAEQARLFSETFPTA